MDEGIIYLNNAATTWPKPRMVIEEVNRSLELPYFEEGRTTLCEQIDYTAVTREDLARFFHVPDPSHFIFTQNATDSLNFAIHGFVKKIGRQFHVITTELEHNAVLRPLRTLEREGRITLSVVPFTEGYVSPDSVMDAITPETRLAVITHGSNVLGTVQDIEKIGECLRSHGIFLVVDGAQTAGQIPIDLGRAGIDLFAFTGHKAFFGLPGIGSFWIRDPSSIEPVRQGGTGVDSRSPFQTGDMPWRFEAGTHNYPGIVSLHAGIQYIERRGLSRIGRETMEMTRYLIAELKSEPHITLHHDHPDLPVIPFTVQDLAPDNVGFILARMYRIICRTGLHCAPLVHERIDGGEGCVRLSLSCLNMMEQCRITADAIREVARGADNQVQQA